MQIITPVLLDLFLFYYYLNSEYRIKGTHVRGGGYIILLACVSSIVANMIPKVAFIQIFIYILIMPLIVTLFYGNVWIKIATYLKLLLILTVLNLLGISVLNRFKDIDNEEFIFILFVVFTIVVRIVEYLLLKRRGERIKINYFEITSYRDILIKGIISIILLTSISYIMMNEGILHTELLWNIGIVLLAILVALVISIFESVEVEAQKALKKMREEQQIEIERNYLNVITTRTQELTKIRHDIKNHIFMINYLAEKNDIEGIKEYLGRITIIEEGNLITIPQKEWLGALIFSKSELAKKSGIKFEFDNRWSPKQTIYIDNMDLLSLIGNLLDNAIEASQKVIEKEKREIGIVLNQNKGYLMIDVWNYFNKDYLRISKNGFKTTKRDKQLHGKGMEIIREITERYEGDFSYTVEKNKITMQITIQNITMR